MLFWANHLYSQAMEDVITQFTIFDFFVILILAMRSRSHIVRVLVQTAQSLTSRRTELSC